MKVIICECILVTVGIVSLIYWHKKIDADTTWVYAIYIAIIIILSVFALITIEQFWIIHK